MKTEVSNEAIEDIATKIGLSVRSIIRNKLLQLEDDDLIAHIRELKITDHQKVTTYLENTKLNWERVVTRKVVTVKISFLANAFKLSSYKMKVIRDAIAAAGSAKVWRHYCHLTIRYWCTSAPPQPQPVPTQAT